MEKGGELLVSSQFAKTRLSIVYVHKTLASLLLDFPLFTRTFLRIFCRVGITHKISSSVPTLPRRKSASEVMDFTTS